MSTEAQLQNIDIKRPYLMNIDFFNLKKLSSKIKIILHKKYFIFIKARLCEMFFNIFNFVQDEIKDFYNHIKHILQL